MATPSLALIPTGFKAGKLYSVLPEDGTGDFDVTRASTATRVNEQGLIESMANNVPRLDYTDGGCPVLLTEPQSTNLITYSEDFSNAYWTKVNTVNTPLSTISPDGTTNASLIVGNLISNTTYIRANTVSGTVIGNTYTLSLYVKPKGGSTFFKYWARNTDAGIIIFDLVNGTTDSPLTSTITSVNNGWFRITTTGELTSSGVVPYFYPYYSATEIEGFYIWGAQLEDSLTSYIPTNGSTVTRVKDVVNNAGDVNTFNSEEGTLFVEFSLKSQVFWSRIKIANGSSSSDSVVIMAQSNNSLRIEVRVGNVVKVSIVSTVSDLRINNRLAFVWKSGDNRLYQNGNLLATNTDTFTPLFNFDNLNYTYINNFAEKTKQLKVFKTALTDAELIALTS